MVSLARAGECIGRRIEHINMPKVKGTVDHVDKHDVWVRTSSGEVLPCIPEHLKWVSGLTAELRDGIESGYHEENAQVFYDPGVYLSEAGEDMGYDEHMPGLAIVGSSATANDDGNNHPLVLIADQVRRVYPLRMTVSPDLAWEIEELLGWAEP